jgi:hypothetical protein
MDVVLSILRMQPPSTTDAPGLCAVSSLTAEGKVVLELCLQLAVGVFMVLLIMIQRCAFRSKPTPGFRQARRSLPSDLHVSLLTADGDPSNEESLHLYSLSMQVSACEDDRSYLGRVGMVSGGNMLPQRARLVTASVNFCVTAYSTVTIATIKMLHCMWVPGTSPHQRRLFIRGSTICAYSGWQLPYVLSLVVLVALPLALPLAAAWSLLPRPQGTRSHWLGAPRSSQGSALHVYASFTF